MTSSDTIYFEKKSRNACVVKINDDLTVIKDAREEELQDVSLWLDDEEVSKSDSVVVWRCTGTGPKRRTWVRRRRRRGTGKNYCSTIRVHLVHLLEKSS